MTPVTTNDILKLTKDLLIIKERTILQNKETINSLKNQLFKVENELNNMKEKQRLESLPNRNTHFGPTQCTGRTTKGYQCQITHNNIKNNGGRCHHHYNSSKSYTYAR